ncbi:MAG: hypothetical protein ABJA16_03505, partial [Nakamurella sp.]
MATIHRTTLVPGKLELAVGWIADQPWYVAHGEAPTLAKAGGFWLDDPAGEVGIEFMVVSDTAPDGTVAYHHVPVTYRAAAVDGPGLIGTTGHGVLGPRWVYDGTGDPVLLSTLTAFVNTMSSMRGPEAERHAGPDRPVRTDRRTGHDRPAGIRAHPVDRHPHRFGSRPGQRHLADHGRPTRAGRIAQAFRVGHE